MYRIPRWAPEYMVRHFVNSVIAASALYGSQLVVFVGPTPRMSLIAYVLAPGGIDVGRSCKFVTGSPKSIPVNIWKMLSRPCGKSFVLK